MTSRPSSSASRACPPTDGSDASSNLGCPRRWRFQRDAARPRRCSWPGLTAAVAGAPLRRAVLRRPSAPVSASPGHQAGAPLRPLDSPVAVQFLHRWLAVVVVVGALVEAARLYRAGARPHALALKVAVVAQFLPGALTLVHAVPVALGVAHQAGAVVLLVVTVVAAHWWMGGARSTAGQRREAAR